MKDKNLCSALVDQLCHKACLVNMTGQLYRVRETQNKDCNCNRTCLPLLYLFKGLFFQYNTGEIHSIIYRRVLKGFL